MQEILALLPNALESRWRFAFIAAALVVTLSPKLVDLYRDWLDLRSGRRRLQLEKERLEVLKLRYEIEALRGHGALPEGEADEPEVEAKDEELIPSITMEVPTPEPAPTFAPAPPSLTAAPSPPPPEPQKKRQSMAAEIAPDSLTMKWLQHHPRIGRAILPPTQFALGLLVSLFGVTTITAPVTFVVDSQMDVPLWVAALAAIFYAALTWTLFVGFKRVRGLSLTLKRETT
jgi:hypothetical protein